MASSAAIPRQLLTPKRIFKQISNKRFVISRIVVPLPRKINIY
jgi:hypothetical protein